MRRFEIREPSTLREACKIISEEEDARFIAGGTALLILIKQGLFVPKTLVNLKRIKEAREITYNSKDGLRIGGLVSIYDIECAPAVREHYPLLAQACHVVANIRIRNMATLGGNLAHADYQSDPPAALVALNASVQLTSSNGTRDVKLVDFLLGAYETALEPAEFLTAVLVPPPLPMSNGIYLKFTTRSSEDRPCAGIAAMMRCSNDVFEDVRVVVGAVSSAPLVVAGQVLIKSKKQASDSIEEIAWTAGAAVAPVDDLRGSKDYKRRLVTELVRRALTGCMA